MQCWLEVTTRIVQAMLLLCLTRSFALSPGGVSIEIATIVARCPARGDQHGALAALSGASAEPRADADRAPRPPCRCRRRSGEDGIRGALRPRFPPRDVPDAGSDRDPGGAAGGLGQLRARFCSASWEDLLSGKAASAEVRVFASPGDYHNVPFEDERQWTCLRLMSPDLPDRCRAVCGYSGREQRPSASPRMAVSELGDRCL